MKTKSLLLLLLSVFLLTNVSCKKDKGEDEVAPESFTKKAILEEFTGEWCGFCPDGANIIRQIESSYPDTFYAISYHIGDSFEVSDGAYYDNKFNHYGYPGGVVNRNGEAGSRANWESKVSQSLSETPTCGIKIETSVSGDKMNVKVKYAGTENFDAFISVMVIEDKVPESSPGAQNGAAAGYKHPDLFRKVLTDRMGDEISVKKGEVKSVSFNDIDLSAYNKSNVRVVAFIHKDLNGNERTVYNAQGVKAGDTQDFD